MKIFLHENISIKVSLHENFQIYNISLKSLEYGPTTSLYQLNVPTLLLSCMMYAAMIMFPFAVHWCVSKWKAFHKDTDGIMKALMQVNPPHFLVALFKCFFTV